MSVACLGLSSDSFLHRGKRSEVLFKIYFDRWSGGAESGDGKRARRSSSVCWFTRQVPAVNSTGPAKSQEPGLLLGLPSELAGTPCP